MLTRKAAVKGFSNRVRYPIRSLVSAASHTPEGIF